MRFEKYVNTKEQTRHANVVVRFNNNIIIYVVGLRMASNEKKSFKMNKI
jgi:hypothetical protein